MMQLLEKIKLIVLDVDGTMTDGGVYIDNNEIETKKFNITIKYSRLIKKYSM